MKRLMLFILAVCIFIPSAAQAKWVIETEPVDIGATFTLDAPTTTKPAPGGGYFLGDGPTTIKPEHLTGAAPTPKPTPEPEINEPIEIMGDYTKGSVYGPKLSTKELEKVRDAVEKALGSCIRKGMSEKEKIIALIDYLCDACKYADRSKANSNNAYGALIEGKAQCSGYARAFKALCDGAGIGCHYVHAAANDPVNPSHQWCLVEYKRKWYHIDPQMIDDYIRIVNGKITYPRPITLMANHLTHNKGGLPETAEKSIVLR